MIVLYRCNNLFSGCVHSMTQSPTTQAPSCGSTETSNAALNPFTPFSDVKITKLVATDKQTYKQTVIYWNAVGTSRSKAKFSIYKEII